MNTLSAPSYKRYRVPIESISHAIWLYFRFSLSYRDVEELRAERGIVVTYETIRQWCQTFGQQYAHRLRRRRPQTGDTWHLDEVFLKINGKQHSLCVPSISTEPYVISWCKAAAIQRRRRRSSARCSRDATMSRG